MFAGQGNGLLLILLALAFLLLVLVIIAFRRSFSNKFPRKISSTVQTFADIANTNEGILLVQAGGRIEYINDIAREWFGLRPGEQPDLERLIRRARPTDDFLSICAVPGQKRLSIDKQLVEVTSYRVPNLYSQMLVVIKVVEFSKNISDTGDGASILHLISEFSRDVSSSLDLNNVIHAVLLNVMQLISADILEVKIWDSSLKTFTPFTLAASSGVIVSSRTSRNSRGTGRDS